MAKDDAPICPATSGGCAAPHDCARRCRRWVGPVPIDLLMSQKPALHFVGFTDDRYWNAVRVFGLPDFVHRVWDERAKAEIMPGDVAIFAQYHPDSPRTPFSWNDSERF